MPFTTNKGLSVQSAGSNSGVWGAGNPGNDLNTGVMGILDNNLGGVVSKSLSSSNVTLTAEESQNLVVRLTGTLLANVIITTPGIGFYIIDNQTSGNFTVEVEYTGGVGTSVFAEQGVLTLVIIDSTNGVRAEGQYPDLMAINALTGTGILRRTGTNTWGVDAGVTDLADTTANRLFGTDGSGNSGLITTDASLQVSAGVVSAVPATQSQMEAQEATAPTFASVQKYHPMHPKAWVIYNLATQTILASSGISGVVRNSTGFVTITVTSAFSSANAYGVIGTARAVEDGQPLIVGLPPGGTKSTDTIQVFTRQEDGTSQNSTELFVAFFGDLA